LLILKVYVRAQKLKYAIIIIIINNNIFIHKQHITKQKKNNKNERRKESLARGEFSHAHNLLNIY
jgi:hypothetical protein